MCHCALFSALLGICAWISIPFLGVHISLQTFGIFLALLTLGGCKGSITVGLYLLLGAAGLPVFAGFQGGIHVLGLQSGGFLFGFMLTALLYWVLSSRVFNGKWSKIAAVALSMLPCYSLGIWWLCHFLGGAPSLPVIASMLAGFLVPDCLKLLLAWQISQRLRPALLP